MVLINNKNITKNKKNKKKKKKKKKKKRKDGVVILCPRVTAGQPRVARRDVGGGSYMCVCKQNITGWSGRSV